MLHIRPARPDEMPIIAEVERQVWSRAAASQEELARRQAFLPQAFLVAEESGVILGMVNAIRWSERRQGDIAQVHADPRGVHAYHDPWGEVLYIVSVGVLPRYRGRGIGRRLIEREIEIARRMGVEKVQLIGHARSQPLYERIGFKAVRELRDFMPEHGEMFSDAVLMEYTLP